MASIIKIKRSETTGQIPSSLELGEIAVNLFDRKLYVGNSTGISAIGGEDFRLATQSSDEGAIIKLNGDTTQSSNSVLLEAGTDLDITHQANGSILFELEDTISSNTAGNAGTATALETARNIAGQSFDGTADITIAATDLSDTDQSLATTDDVSFNSVTADVTGNLTGNADTATALETARSIAGQSFDGTADITIAATDLSDTDQSLATTDDVSFNTVTADVTGDLTGNADTASALDSSVTITLSGDVAGSATFVNGGDTASITATIQADSVALGTDTTGDYVESISGTANEIEVSGSGEGSTVTIGLPDDVTVAGQLDVGENVVVTGNTSIGGNLEVAGNLDVTGSVTYLSSSTVNVDDTMLKLAANNSADVSDHGVYAQYVEGGTTKWAGYFRDASDNSIFKFYTDVEVEPTTTVDINATGYTQATIEATIDGGSY